MKCIRVLADVNQIKQCKEDLSKVETQTRSISKVLGLAGNEVRLKMLYLIYQEGELCPCDLSDILNMSVPAVSQHLRKLKDGGLVKDKKVGQTVFYSVIDENTLIIRPILKNLVRITQKEAVI
jgi:DNA-binding transcriptional ArsR family regulator